MDIIIFEGLTTAKILADLQKEADSYSGLYVDMEDDDQRKYVKSKAALISGMLKDLERARIDLGKDSKTRIDNEAELIKELLQKANEPFTLLIDDYTIERKKILDAEKVEREAAALLVQIEDDHETAIMMDKIATIEAREKVQAEADRVKEIQDKAAKQATLEAEQKAKDLEYIREQATKENERLTSDRNARVEAEQQEEKARSENKEHRRVINAGIMEKLLKIGISEDHAKKLITKTVKNQIANLSINY